jgi:hypothetical protein
MPHDVTVVFTAKSTERILKEGGTSSWRVRPNHVRQRPYVICTRNAHADWGGGPEAHRSAFLVGRLSDVVPCSPTPENNESPNNRYLIQFSEFARVSVPDVWVKGDRNPIKYMSMEDFEIDPAKLTWEPMPDAGDSPAIASVEEEGLDAKPGLGPLTIAEAKRGLALTFNVAPSAVEITIRG